MVNNQDFTTEGTENTEKTGRKFVRDDYAMFRARLKLPRSLVIFSWSCRMA